MEKRSAERINVDLPCICRIGCTVFSAILKDVSESGVAFKFSTIDSSRLQEALASSSIIKFESEHIEGRCKVIRTDTLGIIGVILVGCSLINYREV